MESHLLSRNIAVVKMITGGIRLQSVSTITMAVAIFYIQFVFKPERRYSRNYVYSLSWCKICRVREQQSCRI